VLTHSEVDCVRAREEDDEGEGPNEGHGDDALNHQCAGEARNNDRECARLEQLVVDVDIYVVGGGQVGEVLAVHIIRVEWLRLLKHRLPPLPLPWFCVSTSPQVKVTESMFHLPSSSRLIACTSPVKLGPGVNAWFRRLNVALGSAQDYSNKADHY